MKVFTGTGHNSNLRKALLLSVSAGTLFSSSAMAQSTPARDGAPKDTEIVVSAKRIGVTEQTAPLAVTGLNADAIAARGVSGTQDLQTMVPGLAAGLELGIPKLYIRGIGQEATTIGQEPAVTTYLDGVPIGRSKAGYITEVDIARVEVLRGPQGTTFGRNATAGAIQYLTQRPLDTFEASATAGVGNYGRFLVGGMVNTPLSPDLSFRIAGQHEYHSGYVQNLGAGDHDLVDGNVTALRGSLQYKKSGLTIVLSADYDREHSNGPGMLLLTQAFVPPYGVTPDNYVLSNGRRVTKIDATRGQANYTRVETYGTSLTVEAELAAGLRLKSISGYRHTNYGQAQDSDATNLDLVGANGVVTKADQYSQEFNLSVNSGALSAVVGAFAYYEDAFEGNDVQFFRGLLNPALGPAALAPANLAYDSNLRTLSLAGFADASYSILPTVRINGGIRYTHDRKKDLQSSFLRIGSTSRNAGFLADSCGIDPAATAPRSVDSELKNSKVTWKAGVDADIADGVFGYATVSTGYKAGGFTDFSLCGLTFKPEDARNYEIGVKAKLFNNAATLRIAGYYLDYSNLQVQKATAFGTTTVNAPGAKIYGVEVEGAARLNDIFHIDGNFSAMHSKYESGFIFGGSDPRPVAQGGNDLVGRRLPRTPSFTANVGLEAHVPLKTGGNVTARVEGFYSSKLKLSPDEIPAMSQPAYAIGNAYVTYEPTDDVRVRAWVRNFTDKFYLTGSLALALPGIVSGFSAPPRTFGVDVTVKLH